MSEPDDCHPIIFNTQHVKIKAPTRHKMSRGKIEDWAMEVMEVAFKALPIDEESKEGGLMFGQVLYRQGATRMRHEIRQILPFFGIPQDVLEKMGEEIDKIGM